MDEQTGSQNYHVFGVNTLQQWNSFRLSQVRCSSCQVGLKSHSNRLLEETQVRFQLLETDLFENKARQLWTNTTRASKHDVLMQDTNH